jgi:hypothetical protein
VHAVARAAHASPSRDSVGLRAEGVKRLLDEPRRIAREVGTELAQVEVGRLLAHPPLSRAWPVQFGAGDWDNEADENVIESVTLTYDFFELIQ